MDNIVIIAVNRDNLLQYCLPAAENFAKKVGAEVEVIKEKKYNLSSKSRYDYIFFERFQAYKYIKDRTLLIDSDVLISPHCPDVFGLFSDDKIWGLIEDKDKQRATRRMQIRLTQNVLGDLGWRRGYVNAGVLLLSQTHKKLFNLSEKELQEYINKGLPGFEDQNLINWLIRSLGYKIGDMGNFCNVPIYRRGNAKESFIVHFAGTSFKEREMKNLYEYWFK